MNEQERNTLLAALRLWQEFMALDIPPRLLRPDLVNIATDGDSLSALTNEKIDALYERINTAPERTEGCGGCYPTLDEPDIDWCNTCRPIPPCTCDADHDGLFCCPCYVPDEEKQPAAATPTAPGE